MWSKKKHKKCFELQVNCRITRDDVILNNNLSSYRVTRRPDGPFGDYAVIWTIDATVLLVVWLLFRVAVMTRHVHL